MICTLEGIVGDVAFLDCRKFQHSDLVKNISTHNYDEKTSRPIFSKYSVIQKNISSTKHLVQSTRSYLDYCVFLFSPGRRLEPRTTPSAFCFHGDGRSAGARAAGRRSRKLPGYNVKKYYYYNYIKPSFLKPSVRRRSLIANMTHLHDLIKVLFHLVESSWRHECKGTSPKRLFSLYCYENHFTNKWSSCLGQTTTL